MNLREQMRQNMRRPKEAVSYRRGQKTANCGLCEYYKNHACSKVLGTINPDMICDLYERKD